MSPGWWRARAALPCLLTAAVLCCPTTLVAKRPASAKRPSHSVHGVQRSILGCARALSRVGGTISTWTADGALENELPPACGGGYEQRSQTADVCRDGCFVRSGDQELALAARFREGNLLVVLRKQKQRFVPVAWLELGDWEVQLLDVAGANRVRRSLVAVHGAATLPAAPDPAGNKAASFYVLSWREQRDGWHGELSAAVQAHGALKLVPLAEALSPTPAPPKQQVGAPETPPVPRNEHVPQPTS